VSEVNLMAERAGFEVRDVENLREHYALTLRRWLEQLDQRRAEVMALTDETLYRTWRLYLSGSVAAFESGQINVNQSLLAKPVGGHSNLPLTRADLYT
jgi:cyclopropane-fatty-acyl-phospholipid synthase